MIRPGRRPSSLYRPRKARPALEALEMRLAPAGIVNGDFSISDPADPQFGYTLRGNATVGGGQGILNEGNVVQSGIAQTFTIQPGATTLRFTIVAASLVPNGGANPPDAFEVALLDATTQLPLVGPPTGLPNTDAFLNIQQTGEVFFAPEVTVPGTVTSGQVAMLDYPLVVTVDVSGIAANTEATISLDLIGFGPATSVVRIDDLVQSAPGSPLLTLNLDPATDSGAVGDGLTRLNPVNLVGNTDPNQQVSLDIDGDGFDDGVATADATGLYRFDGVVLVEGANPLRVQATNAAGTTTASRTVTVDTQAPSGILVAPAPGSTVDQDPGFIEVQWADPGAAGLDEASFGPADVTITGVDVDAIENLGGGRVRYRYSLDGDTLPAGTVTVTLVAGQVSDRAGNTNPQAIQTFTFTPAPNQAPLANPDSYTIAEDAVLTIAAPGVLINDTDPDGDPLAAVLVAGPLSGTLALNPDGSFTYTPLPDFNGTVTFSYRASDGSLVSAPATVTITVTPVNDAPTALDDAFSTPTDTLLMVAAPGVLANDTDVDGDAITAVLVTQAAGGVVVLNPDGSFTYTPNAGLSGPDSFTYRASDGTATSGIATVRISVGVTNTAPVAANDAFTTGEDQTLTVPAPGILANDTDSDGDPLTATLVSGPTHGDLTLNPDGSFTYTPAPDFNGTDTFTYQAGDGVSQSAPATVTITVAPVNDAPVAAPDNYSTPEDTPLTIPAPGVLANDTDVDSPTLTAVLVSGPAHGTLTLNLDGSFTYTPAAGPAGVGTFTFTYRASDGSLQSEPATVTLTVGAPPNRAPVAADDAFSATEDTPLAIAAPGVLGNDSDPDGDPLTVILVAGPSRGTLTLNPDGSFTYAPNADYNGPDSFTYRVSDGSLTSALATVRLTVAPVNDAPTSADDAFTTLQGRTLTVPTPGVLANDSDVDGERLTAALVTAPAHGTLVLNPDGSFTYTPNPGFSGADSFSYRASDGTATGRVATVLLTVTPCPIPVCLLPDTPFFNHLRARRALNPARFDFFHPRVGPLLGLEVNGIPATPTRLLPGTARFDALRARRERDPSRFDRSHPVLGALIRLESPGGEPATAPFLPGLPREALVRARRAANPDRFDRYHPFLGALIALESAQACAPTADAAPAVATAVGPLPLVGRIGQQGIVAGHLARPWARWARRIS